MHEGGRGPNRRMMLKLRRTVMGTHVWMTLACVKLWMGPVRKALMAVACTMMAMLKAKAVEMLMRMHLPMRTRTA